MNSSPTAPPPESSARSGLLHNAALRQFVKFCIVGACNLAIDACVSYVLHYHFHLRIENAKVISFIVAVSNSFYWNSRWTFRALNREKQQQQYLWFVGINIIGLALNLMVIKFLLFLFTGSSVNEHLTKPQFALTTLVPAIVVASWNFTANKKWTFKA